MEPEDQSRNSRPRPDPVTIDLGAEEVKEMPAADSDGAEDNVTAEPADETASSESPSPESSSRSYSGIPDASTSTAASEARETPPSPQPASRGPGSLGLVAAGLLGGLIAVGGAAGLQYWGLLPSLGSNEKAEASLNLMASEIGQLKAKLAEQAAATPKVDFAPLETKLAALEAKVAKVPEANGLSADADARISALSEQVQAADAAGAALKSQSETARAALEMRIEAIEKKLDQPRDDVEVAVAIASASLKAAIDRGGSFTTELDTLEGIKPDDPAVKELRTFASAGVPSRAMLVAEFPKVADAILGATRADDPSQSLTDRLLSSAFGDVEGEGPDAIVARMETRLANGDLAGAAAEWDKLPDPGKTASETYKRSLDARIRVEQLVGTALTRAVSATKTDG